MVGALLREPIHKQTQVIPFMVEYLPVTFNMSFSLISLIYPSCLKVGRYASSLKIQTFEKLKKNMKISQHYETPCIKMELAVVAEEWIARVAMVSVLPFAVGFKIVLTKTNSKRNLKETVY